MNKQDLIQKIKQLDGLTSDEQSELINLLNTKKKYGLVWEDKPEAVEEELRTKLPVLREVVEKRIIAPPQTSPQGSESAKNEVLSKTQSAKTDSTQTILFDGDVVTNNTEIENLHNEQLFQHQPLPPLGEGRGGVPNHILIEGDNLHALTALTFTHEGKIDVIYIDPPYNTGKKDDFRYHDAFKDEPEFIDKEHPFRHSTWLSFMNKRLNIAKQLLSEKGVILISIDDNELAQLKLLCNDIFGNANFVGQWHWYKSATPPNLSLKIKKNVEYVLGYEKSRNNTKYKGIHKESSSDDPITKPQNTLKVLTFPSGTIHFKKNNFIIKAGIYGTVKYPNKLLNDMFVENFTNKNEVSFENRFVWTQPKLIEELLNLTRINCSQTLVISYKKQNYSEEVPPNLIDESVGVDTTEEAGKDLLEMFGEKVFDYPKPISLIKYLLSFKENITILDFFAGSGTTLHATMQLNAEDGGNRQCILVTNNENNICEEVTYERNKRVIEGYNNAKGTWVEGLKGNNLRYYKSEMVPSTKTEINKRLLTQASTDLLCIKEDCYTDLTESLGYNALQCRIFSNDAGKYMMVMYHSRKQWEVCEQLIATIKTLENKTENVKLYGFSPEKETLLEDFAEVADMIDVVPLPEAIYNAYRATFRTLKLDKKATPSP